MIFPEEIVEYVGVKVLERSQPKGVKSKIRWHKLRSGLILYWQGSLKWRDVKRFERKIRATCVRNLIYTVHQVGCHYGEQVKEGKREGLVARVKQIPTAHTELFWYCERKWLRWSRGRHSNQANLQKIRHQCKDSIKPVHDRIQWQAVTKTLKTYGFHASQVSWPPASPSFSSGGLCWLELKDICVCHLAMCRLYLLQSDVPARSVNVCRHTPTYAISITQLKKLFSAVMTTGNSSVCVCVCVCVCVYESVCS